MKIKQLPIDDIIPYARNPRKNDVAVPKVVASIKEFGFRQPIVVNSEMVVICGHTRLKAAHVLGLKRLPVVSYFEPVDNFGFRGNKQGGRGVAKSTTLKAVDRTPNRTYIKLSISFEKI